MHIHHSRTRIHVCISRRYIFIYLSRTRIHRRWHTGNRKELKKAVIRAGCRVISRSLQCSRTDDDILHIYGERVRARERERERARETASERASESESERERRERDREIER